MFLGTYSPRMDAKGRIILPAKFREELSAGLVLTRGQERCLYVFPSAEFERIHERMRSAPCRGEPPATSCEYSSREPRMSYPINRGASPSLRFFGSTPGLATSSWSSGPEPARKSGTPPPGRSTWPAREAEFAALDEDPFSPCSNDSTARRIGRDTETTGTPIRQECRAGRAVNRCGPDARSAPPRFIDTPLTTTQDYLTQEHP